MIFVAVEAAEGDAAGTLGDVTGFDAADDFREGLDESFAFGVAWEDVFVIGRHFLVLNLGDDVFEEEVFFEGGIEAVDVVKGDPALLFFGTVAGDAVLL